jgi:ubiquinone/menaquinone biosynthesis C-methylase UbiE
MGFYGKWILPRLTDLAMRHREAMRYREKVVPQARGTVLEIGAGSGLNLPLYSPTIERYYGLDPSEALLAMARRRAADARFPVTFFAHPAEQIPLGDGSVDTVVMTWVLCSIPDPSRALAETKRVLRTGGVLLFAEHGLAPDGGVRAWQRRLNPVWRKISGGCNLDRRMDALIREAGFGLVELETGYAKGPRPMSYIYSGRAVCN